MYFVIPTIATPLNYTNMHVDCKRSVLLFSSPEHKVLSELLWSFNVRRPSSVRPSVNNFFKQHLLCNRLLDFDQTSQE